MYPMFLIILYHCTSSVCDINKFTNIITDNAFLVSFMTLICSAKYTDSLYTRCLYKNFLHSNISCRKKEQFNWKYSNLFEQSKIIFSDEYMIVNKQKIEESKYV